MVGSSGGRDNSNRLKACRNALILSLLLIFALNLIPSHHIIIIILQIAAFTFFT
jgi:hypothetical protein